MTDTPVSRPFWLGESQELSSLVCLKRDKLRGRYVEVVYVVIITFH